MNIRAMLLLGLTFAVVACGADSPDPDDAATDPPAGEMTDAGPPEDAPAEAPEQLDAPPPESMTGAAEPVDEPEAGSPSELDRFDRLYAVQIAAYLGADEAATLAERLRGRGLPVWTASAQVEGRSWTRVRIGATPSVGEARRLGDWVQAELRSQMWVAPIDTGEPVPNGAVDMTRAFLANR